MNIARQHRGIVTRIVESAEKGEPILLTIPEAAGLFACLGVLAGILKAEEEAGEVTINQLGLDTIENLLRHYKITGVTSTTHKETRH